MEPPSTPEGLDLLLAMKMTINERDYEICPIWKHLCAITGSLEESMALAIYRARLTNFFTEPNPNQPNL